jgi:hypothetical protein
MATENRVSDDLDDEKIIDRLTKLLARVGREDHLKPAAEMAAQQLELLTPLLMVPGRRGMFAGRATPVLRGTTLFLLADPTRVCTIHAVSPPDIGGKTMIEELIEEAEHITAPPEGGWQVWMPTVMFHLLDNYGGLPGEEGPRLGEPGAPMLGSLLAPLQPHQRTFFGEAIDKSRAAEICPVMIGLIGPASSGDADKNCIVWPLFVPLAPYSDYVMERFDD